LLLTIPGVARAHLVNSGLGPFYDGVLHLLMSPGDLLGLIAVSLLAGLRGPKAGRWAVIILPLAWLAGGVVGRYTSVAIDITWLSTLSFLFLGLLVALDAKVSPTLIACLAAGFGGLHGLLNGSALASIGANTATLTGIIMAAWMLALLTTAAVVPLRAVWSRTLVRVAGSWIVAVGMLVLGWALQSTA
jgi:hydrogenase/urease accessory protein HupE